MRETGETDKAARIPIAVPFFYGWFIVAQSFFANLMAAGLRSAPAVFIHPLESEFGVGRKLLPPLWQGRQGAFTRSHLPEGEGNRE